MGPLELHEWLDGKMQPYIKAVHHNWVDFVDVLASKEKRVKLLRDTEDLVWHAEREVRNEIYKLPGTTRLQRRMCKKWLEDYVKHLKRGVHLMRGQERSNIGWVDKVDGFIEDEIRDLLEAGR